MRIPRMTMRRWVVVVLIIGLLMGGIVGGVRLKQTRSRLLSRAQFHERRAAFYPKLERYQRGIAEGSPGISPRLRGTSAARRSLDLTCEP